MKKVLTIAGSDSSGGAGIQADIKTITVHGMYAMSVITALTAQNTVGVSGIMNVPAEFVAKQLDAVFTDIFPDSVKIGMVSERSVIEVITQKLKKYRPAHVVLDPVMVSTSGCRLIPEAAQDILISELMPAASLITPNIREAEVISGIQINSTQDMRRSAKMIFEKTGSSVLIKGGHIQGDAVDVLCYSGIVKSFVSGRIDNPNTHGTGCTLSSAIACNLAAEYSMAESVRRAKEYLTGAICAKLDLGRGSGPLNHMYKMS
ncbi:MAG: bifunctional hydroxymethylpyrimidine kinase/phosphomethylpyrimidine kinase [Clostridia bacterium]|nr:bifunctional hydroxymethylpyrimidine kinase/phosphomethylpyrimidine kinase [Clostridia bacterium]